MSLNPQNAIDGMLSAICDSFKANVKAALVAEFTALMDAELEKIAAAEAQRITDILAQRYHDPIKFAEILHLRLTINNKVVKE